MASVQQIALDIVGDGPPIAIGTLLVEPREYAARFPHDGGCRSLRDEQITDVEDLRGDAVRLEAQTSAKHQDLRCRRVLARQERVTCLGSSDQ